MQVDQDFDSTVCDQETVTDSGTLRLDLTTLITRHLKQETCSSS